MTSVLPSNPTIDLTVPAPPGRSGFYAFGQLLGTLGLAASLASVVGAPPVDIAPVDVVQAAEGGGGVGGFGGGGGGMRTLYRLVTDAAETPVDNFVSNAAKGLAARGAEIGNPAIHGGISTFDTIEGAASRISVIERSGRVQVLGIGELTIPDGAPGISIQQTLGPGHYTITGTPVDIASYWGLTWLP